MSRFCFFAAGLLLFTTLSGCSIPKRYALNDFPGYQSNCVALRADGFVSKYTRQSFLTGKPINEPRSISIFRPGETPHSIYSTEAYRFLRLPKGSQLYLDFVETRWDFENGHRLTIAGKFASDSVARRFIFEEFSLAAPNVEQLLEDVFTPCQADNLKGSNTHRLQ
jgi:hypothetical protein